MNTKNVILVMALATAFLVAAVGSASAVYINNCTIITAPGLYTITDNITNNTATCCIDIQSDDVILDGQEHKIDGVTPSATSQFGICCVNVTSNRKNVTIKNVKVMRFREGIRVGGKYTDMMGCVYKVEDVTIENCVVHDNGANDVKVHGIRLMNCVCNSSINNCRVYNQTGKITGDCGDGGAGIKLHAKCNYNNITNNIIYNNRLSGIHATKKPEYNRVFNNSVYENGEAFGGSGAWFGGGIRLQCLNTNFWTVENNTVTDNWGPGIYVRGRNATVRNNDESGSKNATTNVGTSGRGVGDGFFTCNVNQKLISNRFCDNEYKDINVGSGGSTTGDSDDNTCDKCTNHKDASAPPDRCCVHPCSPGCVANEGTSEAGKVYGCGDLVNCSCTFSGDLTCNPTHGLIVNAPNIVIEGAGYTIDGVTPTNEAGILNYNASLPCGSDMGRGYDNVTINNLTVKNFGWGIWTKAAIDSGAKACRCFVEDITIYNCTVCENGLSTVSTNGIDLWCTRNSSIDNCEIYNNTGKIAGDCGDTGAGVRLYGGKPNTPGYNSITNNEIYNNTLTGIYAKMKPMNNYVAHNRIYGNGKALGGSGTWFGGGIRLQCMKANNWTIEHNDIADNYGPGIFVRGSNNIIRYNNESGSKNATTNVGNSGRGVGDGFFTCAANQKLILNRFCDNEYKDISVGSGGSTTGDSDNNTCDTAFDYCDASAGCPPPCVYPCTVEEEPDLIIEDIRPIRWCCCCIALAEPIRVQKGGDDSEEMQVMFIDDPELAKELGDEELRKEVAEVLAKDPKLAEEIAAKLAGDDEKVAKELSRDPKQLAELCCYRSNVVRELADLLDTELTGQAQHEMSDQLDMIVGGGCCGGCCCDCCLTAKCCCCCGRFVAYKIRNNGTGDAGWSLSNLTVNGRVRSVDIVRPLDAQTSRWDVFPCYRMWWWPHWPREVTVCADITDWVTESDEMNNCRTEWWPGLTPIPTRHP